MIATNAVRNLIIDNRIRQIDIVIETSQDLGMTSLDRSLANLVRNKLITLEKAEFYSLNPKNIKSFL